MPAEIDGFHCIAERPIGGIQCTAEGYILNGEVEVYGIVDSYREGPYQSSFSRYQLPSRLPDAVQRDIAECCRRVVPRLDLERTAFNIEFFWDEPAGRLWLLEVNSRISRSHSPLFIDITGASNHEVAIEVALGRRPDYPRREGCCAVAAKFMMRRLRDARVSRVPTPEELRALEAAFPGSYIEILVQEGQWLSDLPAQDAYSYEVAEIFMGGQDTDDLLREYEALKARLPLEFAEQPDPGGAP